jgi:predicted DsbA family dithiol-disulfide isomerase
MTRVIIPVYFDYASSLCYVAWRVVTGLQDELEFDALWKGVSISSRSPNLRPGRGLGPAERRRLMTVAEEIGIPVTPPEKWLDSEAALKGAELARDAGAFAPYHAGVFRAAFEQRLDIAGHELLGAIAERAGMDRARFLADLQDDRTAARLAENGREADRVGVVGYPTFLLGDFPLTGIQSVNTMRCLISRYIERRRAEIGH